jgi:hypothetical protein
MVDLHDSKPILEYNSPLRVRNSRNYSSFSSLRHPTGIYGALSHLHIG